MAKVRFGDVVRECKINIDRATDTHELYVLKDVDLTQTFIQRMLKKMEKLSIKLIF